MALTPQTGRYVDADGKVKSTAGMQLLDGAGAPLTAIGSKQETVVLATNNVAVAQAVLYGGDYVFAQQATAYGTIQLQALGPDGTTFTNVGAAKTATDATGTLITFGSNATVRVVLTGTTAAYATLSRAP